MTMLIWISSSRPFFLRLWERLVNAARQPDDWFEFLARGFAYRSDFPRSKILHESVYDEVVRQLKNAYGQVRIGDPIDEGTLYGPLHSKEAVDAFVKTIDEAKQSGGKVEYGGKVKESIFEFKKCAVTCVLGDR